MKKYLIFYYLSFQRFLEYRLNLFWHLGGNLVSITIIYFFWVTVLSSGFGSTQYNSTTLGLYYISIALVTMFASYNYHLVADDIRYGDLAIDLVRPYNYFSKVFVEALPEKIFPMAFLLLIYPFLLYFGTGHFPTIGNFLIAFVALILATLIRFFIVLVIGGMAFWFNKVHGFSALFFTTGALFSGQMIPLNLLPTNLLTISQYLPFRYITYVPAQALISNISLAEFLTNTFIQIFWIGVFFLLAKFVWTKGMFLFESAGR